MRVVFSSKTFLKSFAFGILIVIALLVFGGLEAVGVYVAVNFIAMAVLELKYGSGVRFMTSKINIFLGVITTLPALAIVYMETTYAIKLREKMLKKGVDLDEVEKRLKEIDERIDFYYDGSVFVIEAPESIDEKRILSVVPNDIDVKITRV